eukprot:358262-Chlamydomonas_euryale.AAC.8
MPSELFCPCAGMGASAAAPAAAPAAGACFGVAGACFCAWLFVQTGPAIEGSSAASVCRAGPAVGLPPQPPAPPLLPPCPGLRPPALRPLKRGPTPRGCWARDTRTSPRASAAADVDDAEEPTSESSASALLAAADASASAAASALMAAAEDRSGGAPKRSGARGSR